MYDMYNSKIGFNFEKKRYECKNFPTHVYIEDLIKVFALAHFKNEKILKR